VVYSNKEDRKCLTESNGTLTMDLGHMNVVLKYVSLCLFVCLYLVMDFGNKQGFFWSLCRHTASPTSTAGTFTGGVQNRSSGSVRPEICFAMNNHFT